MESKHHLKQMLKDESLGCKIKRLETDHYL